MSEIIPFPTRKPVPDTDEGEPVLWGETERRDFWLERARCLQVCDDAGHLDLVEWAIVREVLVEALRYGFVPTGYLATKAPGPELEGG